jgi:hypothetical protein
MAGLLQAPTTVDVATVDSKLRLVERGVGRSTRDESTVERVPEWTNEARALFDRGDLKKALRVLERDYWKLEGRSVPQMMEGKLLADRIAGQADGRLKRRAASLADSFETRANYIERQQRSDEHFARLDRLKANVTVFVALSIADDHESTGPTAAEFEPIEQRIVSWSRALDSCYSAGYGPVDALGKVALSPPEQIRIEQLMRETINDVCLQHSSAVEDIGELRRSIPACLGYATANDDIRAQELVSALQRHSGKSVELPSEVAMSTSLLDAMELSGAGPEERDLFKFVAGGAFYVGVGAGLEDVIHASCNQA